MKRLMFVLISTMFVLSSIACSDQKGSQPIPGATGAPLYSDQEIATLKSIASNKETSETSRLNAMIKLGNIFMDTERFTDAVEYYGNALEIDPKNTNVIVDMGTSFRRIGRSDLAVKAYKDALAINPNHANANMNLGVVLRFDFQDFAGAKEAFEKFLAVAPTHPNVPGIRQELQNINAALAQQGQTSQ